MRLIMSKIGIMGGTFDPPHCGHLNIAEIVYNNTDADKIMFLPSGTPAYKLSEHAVSSKEDRLNMLNLLIDGLDWCFISELECEREGNTYTSDTLEYLKENDPENEYFLIIGSDSLRNFKTWHCPEVISRLAQIVVYLRGDDSLDRMKKIASKYNSEFGTIITFVEGPIYNISSTQIRNAVKSGGELVEFLPEKIAKYIKEHGLYME